MSIQNGSTAENKTETEKSLESALQRVVSLKQQKLVPHLDHILMLARQKEEVLAVQIFARKELQCPVEDDDQSVLPDGVMKNQLYIQIRDHHNALINHRLIKNSMQSAAFDIQIQEAVRGDLQKAILDDTMDHFPQRGVLLAHCSSNREDCKELANIIKQNANIDKEIVELHMKYSSMLKEIRQKWEALQDRVMIGVQGKSKALAQLQTKTKERENRIQLLVTMIQGLISSCGFQFAACEYFVQVLLLCDSIVMQQDSAKQNALMENITKAHEENKENRPSIREMLKK